MKNVRTKSFIVILFTEGVIRVRGNKIDGWMDILSHCIETI
jgi:hypothetical protein